VVSATPSGAVCPARDLARSGTAPTDWEQPRILRPDRSGPGNEKASPWPSMTGCTNLVYRSSPAAAEMSSVTTTGSRPLFAIWSQVGAASRYPASQGAEEPVAGRRRLPL